MRVGLPSGCLTIVTILICGCASDSERLALESQLRTSEATIRQLRSEVEQKQKLLADQDAELAILRESETRGHRGSGAVQTVAGSVEAEAAWGSVEQLRIHELTSGVVASGPQGATVNVVVQPLDRDGEVVKVAGKLHVSVSVVVSDGEKQLLTERDVSITESRSLWTRSLVATGYHIQLDIPHPATDGNLLLAASLDIGRDRKFSASEMVPATQP